ncbi:TPA_asm: hypothetical protein GZM25_07830 [Listeria monocytogenes]|nr:hypothetical protein [Listeria monocytogenes]EAD5628651.1 hypothetical protein [Listeria monocytogenes]EAE1982197.1 hypothetical protein [Listeria monocytogenes]EAE4748238.1 hypothetical protein [Listeria monocytogenes]EAG7323928.1 hypothetical protein [Listeria monocytogenes]
MTVTSNINSELADGFQGYTDVRKITVNSTVDVGVSGSLTAGFASIGSFLGPEGAILGGGAGLLFDVALEFTGAKDATKNKINNKIQQLEDWIWIGNKAS